MPLPARMSNPSSIETNGFYSAMGGLIFGLQLPESHSQHGHLCFYYNHAKKVQRLPSPVIKANYSGLILGRERLLYIPKYVLNIPRSISEHMTFHAFNVVFSVHPRMNSLQQEGNKANLLVRLGDLGVGNAGRADQKGC